MSAAGRHCFDLGDQLCKKTVVNTSDSKASPYGLFSISFDWDKLYQRNLANCVKFLGGSNKIRNLAITVGTEWLKIEETVWNWFRNTVFSIFGRLLKLEERIGHQKYVKRGVLVYQ